MEVVCSRCHRVGANDVGRDHDGGVEAAVAVGGGDGARDVGEDGVVELLLQEVLKSSRWEVESRVDFSPSPRAWAGVEEAGGSQSPCGSRESEPAPGPDGGSDSWVEQAVSEVSCAVAAAVLLPRVPRLVCRRPSRSSC